VLFFRLLDKRILKSKGFPILDTQRWAQS